MRGLGGVLVHGYLGHPADMAPLADLLRRNSSLDCLETVSLHPSDDTRGRFDIDRFVDLVVQAIVRISMRVQAVLLVGHSTGGIVALEALERLNGSVTAALLVLAGTPSRIDGGFARRWEEHVSRAVVSGRFRWDKRPGLADIGRMVRAVNRWGQRTLPVPVPALLVYGENDGLVPPSEALGFERLQPGKPLMSLIVPDADHDLFAGKAGAIVADRVARTLVDLAAVESAILAEELAPILGADPSVARFLDRSPLSAPHVARSPAGHRSWAGRLMLPPCLPESVPWEPVIANIEVTTRCALRCPHCARTLRGRKEALLSPERFGVLLKLLPHAYQVTLVGLGEPFLHPEIHQIVAQAARCGRKVSLVTSCAGLTAESARAVLAAGIDQVTFSLDTATADLAATLRPGVPLEILLENLRNFVREAREGVGICREKGPPDLAVFSALSDRSVSQADRLCRLAGELGVQAIVFTDLNFAGNRDHALRNTITEAQKHALRRTVAESFRSGLPVLGVRGIEEMGLKNRSRQAALLPVKQLWERSVRHRYCVSPWQTIPVAADGTVTICDCRPDESIGNLFEDPLTAIWNGERMRAFRRSMTGEDPPEGCLACPRF